MGTASDGSLRIDTSAVLLVVSQARAFVCHSNIFSSISLYLSIIYKDLVLIVYVCVRVCV
jgi:hypothetical protein